MVRDEEQWKRCCWYSQYHRTLAPHCYALDIDMIEWRPDRGIVAIMEIKHESDPITAFQMKVLHELAHHFPVYIVRVLDKETPHAVFRVSSVYPRQVSIEIHMTETEYREWIENL